MVRACNPSRWRVTGRTVASWPENLVKSVNSGFIESLPPKARWRMTEEDTNIDFWSPHACEHTRAHSTHKKRDDWTQVNRETITWDKADAAVWPPKAKGYQELLRASKSQKWQGRVPNPCLSLQKARICWHLGFTLQSRKMEERIKACFYKPLSLWPFATTDLEKLINKFLKSNNIPEGQGHKEDILTAKKHHFQTTVGKTYSTLLNIK